MYRHNFFIVQENDYVQHLTAKLYESLESDHAQTFIKINKIICKDEKVHPGQTLYLPDLNTPCEIHEVQAILKNIDLNTEQLRPEEKRAKAQNHLLLALGLVSQSVEILDPMIDYRLDRIKGVLEKQDDLLGSWFRDNYQPGRSIRPVIELAMDGKWQIERELDSFTSLAFTHKTPRLYTGMADRLKLRLEYAKRGIVNPELNVGDWQLGQWEKYHINLNRLTVIAKGVGWVGLGLNVLEHADSVVEAYERLGMTDEFGHEASHEGGDLFGSIWGTALGASLGKSILEEKLMQKVAAQLTLSLVADSDILLAGEIIAGGAAAVAALPELVVLGGSMVFVAAVSVVVSKVGAAGLRYITKTEYGQISHLYHLVTKRCYRWF